MITLTIQIFDSYCWWLSFFYVKMSMVRVRLIDKIADSMMLIDFEKSTATPWIVTDFSISQFNILFIFFEQSTTCICPFYLQYNDSSKCTWALTTPLQKKKIFH